MFFLISIYLISKIQNITIINKIQNIINFITIIKIELILILIYCNIF